MDDASVLKPLEVPIPSNDPNDPLNWSTAAKVTTYGIICIFSFIANVNGSNFTVAIVPLEKEFHTDSTRAVFLVGFNVLMFGLGNVLWVPLMRVLGKRPVYLIALLVFVAANAWSAVAQSWGSLLGGRMVAGFGAAAADATVPSAVADMFSLEHRGHCMMFFHIALATGIFGGPGINAWLVQLHSWRWSCAFLAIAGGLLFVLAVFGIRETSYVRPRIQHAQHEIPAKRGYVGWLGLSVGYNKDGHFLRTVLDIVRMAFYPPVFYVGCIVGLWVGWIIVIQVTSAQVFVKPPYHWKLGAIGLFSLAGLTGALLSFYFGGRLIDILSNRARRHDHTDKPRPEKRLIALLLPALFSPIGIIVYGQCISHKTSWVGPAFGYGMQAFGFTALSNIAVTYAVDCYPTLAGEALVTVFVVRNGIAAVCSLYSNRWIASEGIANVTGAMAGLQYALLLLAIPLYLYSSAVLRFTATYGAQKRVVSV